MPGPVQLGRLQKLLRHGPHALVDEVDDEGARGEGQEQGPEGLQQGEVLQDPVKGHEEELRRDRHQDQVEGEKPQARPQGVGGEEGGEKLQGHRPRGHPQGEEEASPEALPGQGPHVLQAEAHPGEELPEYTASLGMKAA